MNILRLTQKQKKILSFLIIVISLAGVALFGTKILFSLLRTREEVWAAIGTIIALGTFVWQTTRDRHNESKQSLAEQLNDYGDEIVDLQNKVFQKYRELETASNEAIAILRKEVQRNDDLQYEKLSDLALQVNALQIEFGYHKEDLGHPIVLNKLDTMQDTLNDFKINNAVRDGIGTYVGRLDKVERILKKEGVTKEGVTDDNEPPAHRVVIIE